MKKLILLTLAAAIAVPAAHAQTSSWTIDPAHSSIQFVIRHMGVSNVHGSLGTVSGTVLLDEKNLTKSSVTASIDVTKLSTGVDARDTHLKSPDFFDVAKNPSLSFTSTAVTNEGGKLKLVGNLTISGVTKPVTLDLDGPAPAQKGQGGKVISGFSASGVIHRSDFNFGPKFAPPVLGNDVNFTIDVEIDKQ